jgi:hypothetical protein
MAHAKSGLLFAHLCIDLFCTFLETRTSVSLGLGLLAFPSERQRVAGTRAEWQEPLISLVRDRSTRVEDRARLTFIENAHAHPARFHALACRRRVPAKAGCGWPLPFRKPSMLAVARGDRCTCRLSRIRSAEENERAGSAKPESPMRA